MATVQEAVQYKQEVKLTQCSHSVHELVQESEEQTSIVSMICWIAELDLSY